MTTASGMPSSRAAFLASVGSAGAFAMLASGTATFAQQSGAPSPPRSVRVIVFPGGFNWPLFAAQEQGFFARENLEVKVTPTPGSVYMFQHLVAGDFDIAMTAIDNIVAYDEGQGDPSVRGPFDLVAFMGGDNGFLRLVVRPEVKSYADLRGKELAVDAPTTGYAFVLRRMLEVNGLHEGDYTFVSAGGTLQRYQAMMGGKYAGSLLGTPFELLAQQQGFHVLGNAVDVIGHYEGIVGAARRSWTGAHRDVVVSYIRAYRNAVAWLYEPSRRDAAVAMLAKDAGMPADLAARSAPLLLDPVNGFSRDAAFDMEGIATVLTLRSAYGQPKKMLSDPARYVDVSYYRMATGS